MGSNLGELLIREKIISAEQLKSAQEFLKKHDVSLGSAIIALGYVSGEEMAQGLSRQLGYPYIDLDQFEVYPDVINLIQAETAKKYMIMPIHRIRSFLTLAMVDPTDLDVIEDIRFRTGMSIQPVIASEAGILNAINKYYGSSHAVRPKRTMDDIELADDSKTSKRRNSTSKSSSSPPTKPPSSPSSIPYSSRPSRRGRATSISSRTRRPSVSGTGSTAFSTRP